MAIEIRPCAPGELKLGLRAIWHYFGAEPGDEQMERFGRILPEERVHVVLDDGEAVGGAGAFPFELTVPGGRVAAAGVTTVAVLPTHRRRGILTQLMRAQLDAAHERGEPVAYLWASEDTIYGRYGYGMASMTGEIDVPRERTSFHGAQEPEGRLRLVGHEEALTAFPHIYDRVRAENAGMFSRTRDWWEVRRLYDAPERRGGGGELMRVLLELDGRPAAYAVYRHHVSLEAGQTATTVNVHEALGDSPAAMRSIWRYLLDIDWIARIKAGLLPLDHPLFFLLLEPRRMRLSLRDGIWVRLVDVEAALAARSYRASEPVVLEVADGFCGWNEGRYRIAPDGVARTGEEADVRLDVSALGSVYLGGYTLAELARALRADELRAGGLARADALFATDRLPWCPEIF
jgi:predicted acetyltransferase